jgi:hypothetical protein
MLVVLHQYFFLVICSKSFSILETFLEEYIFITLCFFQQRLIVRISYYTKYI